MFRRTQMTAAMSQELMDELTDHGCRDLSQLRMDDLESDVYELVDAITRRVWRLSGVRASLANSVDRAFYSRCPVPLWLALCGLNTQVPTIT